MASSKISKYEYLKLEEILPSEQGRKIKQARCTFSSLGKVFQIQVATIEELGNEKLKLKNL